MKEPRQILTKNKISRLKLQIKILLYEFGKKVPEKEPHQQLHDNSMIILIRFHSTFAGI